MGFQGTVTIPNIPASITSVTVGGTVYPVTNGSVAISALYRDDIAKLGLAIMALAAT